VPESRSDLPAGVPDGTVTRQLLAFVEHTSDLVGVVDDASRIVYLNDAARKRLGVADGAGLTTGNLFPPDAFARYYDEVRPALLHTRTWRGEIPVLTASGDATPMDVTVVADVGPGGEVRTLVAFGRELDAAPRGGLGAGVVADALTGLPGPDAIDERIAAALARGARSGARIAVIVADVDGMSDLNASFGRARGDEVLRRIAHAMSRVTRLGDTVARIRDDTFAVVVTGLQDGDTAWEVVERLRAAVGEVGVDLGDGACAVSASFGLAIAEAGDEPAALLRRAEGAMRRAKSVGGARTTMFEADTGVTITTLADELALAVSHGLIRPHVHSVVELDTGELVGYQGLARWAHPRHGLLEADQFIHLVAGTPVLPVIDLAVLRRTAAAAARRARSGASIRAYGHLSRRLLGDLGAERYLAEIVDDLGVAAPDLCVEVAHAIVARPSRTVETALRTLHDLGVRLVLSGVDAECDVGDIVGYGFDELRLDRRLVRDATRDPARRRMARGTVALARALGLRVIAVGIESEDDRARMLDAGCHDGEGFLFGPVRPAGDVA